MAQTLNEMRVALTAFERDKAVLSRAKAVPPPKWVETSNPCWNFDKYEYKPLPQRIFGYLGIFAGGITTAIRDSIEEVKVDASYCGRERQLLAIVAIDCQQTENT